MRHCSEGKCVYKGPGKVSAIRVIRRILLGGEGSYIAFTGYLFT